jgi:DNA uptake protein ComE-like DNA-binding protein
MNIRSFTIRMIAALLLLTTAFPLTAEDKPAPQVATGKTTKDKALPPPAGTRGKLKPVDINGATKNELSFMLGIPESVAAKIVTGRPYRTKAHLLTHQIVSAEVYARIKDKVIAKQ